MSEPISIVVAVLVVLAMLVVVFALIFSFYLDGIIKDIKWLKELERRVEVLSAHLDQLADDMEEWREDEKWHEDDGGEENV